MRRKAFFFLAGVIISLSMPISDAFPSEAAAAQNQTPAFSSTDASKEQLSLAENDDILVQSRQGMLSTRSKDRTYSVKTAGALPIHDADFKDFLDYGVSIVFGIEKNIKHNFSIQPTVGLVALTGEWNGETEREVIRIEEEEYYPGFISGDSEPITAEDLPEDNLGIGYHSEGEAIVTSAEVLSAIDLKTDLYIFPLTLNVLYRPKGSVEKINPYIGGGLGFCVARRDSESKILKEESYLGPNYRVTLNDSQTVTGQVLQFIAGFEIPFKKNIKLVAEASTALYDLESFDPIIEIAYRQPNPPGNTDTDISSWTYEDPVEIGVFKEEFVTSLSIGVIVPF